MRIDLDRSYCPECEAVWYGFARKGERLATEQELEEYPWVTATKDLREAYAQAGPEGDIYKVRRLDSSEEPVEIEQGWFEFPAAFIGWVEKRSPVRSSAPYPMPGPDHASE
jgi:hypothetical protein